MKLLSILLAALFAVPAYADYSIAPEKEQLEGRRSYLGGNGNGNGGNGGGSGGGGRPGKGR